MKDELKKEVIPFLREQGFKGSYPTFRRIKDNMHQILNFQLNKHGGSFTVNLSVVKPIDNFFKVPQKEFVNIGGARLGTRELYIKDKSYQDYWFKFLRGFIFYRQAYNKVVKDFIQIYEKEADKIFKDTIQNEKIT